MHFDAWAAAKRPDGVATPIASLSADDHHYVITSVAGRRVAVVPPGDPAAVSAAARAARADGQADLVVALGVADGADVIVRALPSAGEAVTMTSNGAPAPLDLTHVDPDPRIAGLH
jgi:hypothetical protein